MIARTYLGDVLGELDARGAFDLDQFVDAPQCGLRLAGHEVRADAERVDRVALRVEGQQHVLVDVVGRHDYHLVEQRAALHTNSPNEQAKASNQSQRGKCKGVS